MPSPRKLSIPQQAHWVAETASRMKQVSRTRRFSVDKMEREKKSKGHVTTPLGGGERELEHPFGSGKSEAAARPVISTSYLYILQLQSTLYQQW